MILDFKFLEYDYFEGRILNESITLAVIDTAIKRSG
jgi:hypothetical protein